MAQMYGQNGSGKWVPLLSPTVSNAAQSSVAGSISQQTLRSAATGRRGLFVFNDSAAVLYLSYATGVTTSNYTVQVAPNGYWEMPQPIYTGNIYGLWASATGNARVTELS